MAEISFYHLHVSPLEKALPRLLEKVIAKSKRAVIRAGSDERVEVLNQALWTYTTKVFLPHGSKKDGFIDRQPIYLTAGNDNPNGASVLVMVDGIELPLADAATSGYEKFLDMFDGTDAAQLEAARKRWSAYKEAGHSLVYWKQNAKGGWEEGART